MDEMSESRPSPKRRNGAAAELGAEARPLGSADAAVAHKGCRPQGCGLCIWSGNGARIRRLGRRGPAAQRGRNVHANLLARRASGCKRSANFPIRDGAGGIWRARI